MCRFKEETEVSKEMRRRNVTNLQLAEKSGYALRSVDAVRRGIRTKQRTFDEIWQALLMM